MNEPNVDWAEGLAAAVTVSSADGTILAMNAAARAVFERDGGAALIGRNLRDCHPAEANRKIARIVATGEPNHYTIRKRGRRKIIHQLPWLKDGVVAGIVEISIPIPDDMPHFDRDAKQTA